MSCTLTAEEDADKDDEELMHGVLACCDEL